MERRYSSPLREQQQEMTRARIMEALLALITEGKIADFTVRDVAKRAGVSYASVYRHYPTREALLDALTTWVELLPQMPPMPMVLAELPEWTKVIAAAFAASGETTMAVSRALTVLNVLPEGTRRRDAHLQALVAAAVPRIGQAELRQVAAIFRHLSNSGAWTALQQRYGLSADETAAALSWATGVLIDSLLDKESKPSITDPKEGI
jgi:AcrR family transcriptional regulator